MNILNLYIPEWIFVALNLLILTLVLNKVLFKRVNAVLDKRQQTVTQSLNDAKTVRSQKQDIAQRVAALDAELDRKTAQQMTQARMRAGREYDRIVDEAQHKARALIASAQVQAERERESILLDARAEVVSTALHAAEVLLRANIDEERNRELIHALLEEESAS